VYDFPLVAYQELLRVSCGLKRKELLRYEAGPATLSTHCKRLSLPVFAWMQNAYCLSRSVAISSCLILDLQGEGFNTVEDPSTFAPSHSAKLGLREPRDADNTDGNENTDRIICDGLVHPAPLTHLLRRW
jgi:hypothetical protein